MKREKNFIWEKFIPMRGFFSVVSQRETIFLDSCLSTKYSSIAGYF
ncbi:hypothetical protein LEP1GSC161_1956 [Leptospira santarosai str. CBC1416]|uniref:Uncharacterized protein n=3 Tax=Leptospira santarosai TaxID=28183 RepID=M6UGB2_9LEPT|nr:hypothetical protein LEP1GSC179_3760 [Leptospira santarosai str. MOR084]EKO78693.1 hypothetical protein LEP1GSC068_2702 [Leptospira sp. Fiocruz LV3954]EKR91119.1 hypothetical protein LEP1GSC163_3477 [Leptospira santarosai str. CBC379]EMF91887.1 hypothetical protein LEP1GSC005_3739 [Leptospira santarosai str. ST188]EMI68618.1 hypothetical protein LEP1GSC076_0479 [Leptospira sp. Fiocruz LV4135]EMJ47877.1 hypothetical protein LEP1GSC169_2928 [Leptospira santarosai str. HAI1349]EMM85578.1 hypo